MVEGPLSYLCRLTGPESVSRTTRSFVPETRIDLDLEENIFTVDARFRKGKEECAHPTVP